MAREQRRNREYYYRKQRQGRKVISEYVGTGILADYAEAMDERKHGQEEQRRAEWQAAKLEAEQLDAILGEVEAAIEPVVVALMLVNGYHQHKRQWRKRRGKNSS